MDKMNKKPVIVTFKLFPGRDDDLIDFLHSIGSREKSSYIRLAIRSQFITRVDLNKTGLFPQPGIARPPEETDLIISPAPLSDEDIEARLDRW